ncbi:MAG: DUF3459 domain-containing protein [Candidatus Binatia bacterium]|nr:DUF3459 domain-containing protein [Candidatus Binatia bacterium]
MEPVTDADSRAWWQEGVLGRLADTPSADPKVFLPSLGQGDGGLGTDGVLVRSAGLPTDGRIFDVARDANLRVVIEFSGSDAEDARQAATEARAWLERGAAGIAFDLPPRRPAPRAKLTRLYGAPNERHAQPPDPPEALRRVVAEFEDRVLIARRATDLAGPPPHGPDLVIETVLTRQPWRAATFGQAIETAQAALPVTHWPGYAMGVPKRGPFAVGLSVEDSLACSAALHLTLRGTPCIELGEETGLPANAARRAWYRRLIDLRRREAALNSGDFRRIAQEKSVLGYLREFEAERLVVLLNLGRRSRKAHLPTGFSWTVLLGVGPEEGKRLAGGEISLPGCGVLIARADTPQSRTLGGLGQRRATGR